MGFRFCGFLAAVALAFGACLFGARAADGAAMKPLGVLCSMFPIQQIARNVVGDAPHVALDIMIPAEVGCPHEYALTPRDMTMLARADILVINGLGMEEFLGASVKRANPHMLIVDASRGVDDLLRTDGHDGAEEGGVNPHLFTSPKQNARMAESMARQLAEADPERAAFYRRNALRHAATMRALADEMARVCAGFVNRRVVETQGVFAYLIRDCGLEAIAAPHPRRHGEELSAADMIAFLATIRREKPAAILLDAAAPDRAGQLLAAETGVPIVLLDAVSGGPRDAPPEYYETVMRRNLAALRAVMETEAP